jgi:hypothetical protein
MLIDENENLNLEKGFRLRVKASLGGKYDKQGWPVIEGSLNCGDPYGASKGNETLMRTRKPLREVSKEDFKVAVPSNIIIPGKMSPRTIKD